MKRKLLNAEFVFASVINYLELLFVWAIFLENCIYACMAVLITLVILYSLVLTPLTDIYYRYVLGMRNPTERESARIKAAWDLVTRGAEEKGVRIPSDLMIYVKDANDQNACAVGRKTIMLHTALLAGIIKDEEIAGVIGHEVGHIVNGDTVSLLMSIQGTVVLKIIGFLYHVAGILVAKLFTVVFSLFGLMWFEGNLDAGIGLGRIIGFFCAIPGKIIDLCVLLIARVETAGYMFFSRKEEFAADQFSTSIGLGRGLRDNLSRGSSSERVNKFSLEYILKGTHPPTSERIERIEMTMRQMEDDKKREEQYQENRTDQTVQNSDKNAETMVGNETVYSAEEQFQAAMQYMKSGDKAHAVLLLKKAADGGCSGAYTELGRCYLYGIGVNPNKGEAVRFLKKSLECGDAEGIYLLAECYASMGKEEKYAAVAFRCYYKSGSRGNAAAMAKAGLCWLEGRGIEKNEKAAYDCLRTAVEERNYQKAAYHLGRCYIQGIGTPADVAKGMAVLRKGIQSGCDDADKARRLLNDCTVKKSEVRDDLQDLFDLLDE